MRCVEIHAVSRHPPKQKTGVTRYSPRASLLDLTNDQSQSSMCIIHIPSWGIQYRIDQITITQSHHSHPVLEIQHRTWLNAKASRTYASTPFGARTATAASAKHSRLITRGANDSGGGCGGCGIDEPWAGDGEAAGVLRNSCNVNSSHRTRFVGGWWRGIKIHLGEGWKRQRGVGFQRSRERDASCTRDKYCHPSLPPPPSGVHKVQGCNLHTRKLSQTAGPTKDRRVSANTCAATMSDAKPQNT